MAKANAVLGVILFLLIIVGTVYLFSVIADLGKQVKVTAKLDDSSISSGSSTELVVSTTNIGSSPIKGIFNVVPDNSKVSVIQDNRIFEINPKEDTGDRRIKISAVAESERQDFSIKVYFLDAETKRSLGDDEVILKVTR